MTPQLRHYQATVDTTKKEQGMKNESKIELGVRSKEREIKDEIGCWMLEIRSGNIVKAANGSVEALR